MFANDAKIIWLNPYEYESNISLNYNKYW